MANTENTDAPRSADIADTGVIAGIETPHRDRVGVDSIQRVAGVRIRGVARFDVNQLGG